MASIDLTKVTLRVTVPGTKPTISPDAGPPRSFICNAPTIDADASIELKGNAGEDVSRWTLGFVQLKYVGTDHARYRGALDKNGSVLVSNSNTILCRDTDIGSTEIWYDSLNSGGTVGPRGTNKLAAGTVIPASKSIVVRAHLFDRPRRGWSAVRVNTLVPGNPNNFLHYSVGELLFCTMLVARSPAGVMTMLKHFYWNVIWEHTYQRDRAGNVVLNREIRLQHNVQQPVQSGNPRDSKFFGREYDLTLPISNTISRRAPQITQARDWSQG